MIHHRNLQILAIEIYKALNNLSSALMSELFTPKNIKYNLRKGTTLVSNNVRTTTYGLNSVSYLAPKIWEQIPEDIKKLYIFSYF